VTALDLPGSLGLARRQKPPGQRSLVPREVGWLAFKNDSSAIVAGARSEVDNQPSSAASLSRCRSPLESVESGWPASDTRAPHQHVIGEALAFAGFALLTSAPAG
jgi:hypothetical protein